MASSKCVVHSSPRAPGKCIEQSVHPSCCATPILQIYAFHKHTYTHTLSLSLSRSLSLSLSLSLPPHHDLEQNSCRFTVSCIAGFVAFGQKKFVGVMKSRYDLVARAPLPLLLLTTRLPLAAQLQLRPLLRYCPIRTPVVTGDAAAPSSYSLLRQ